MSVLMTMLLAATLGQGPTGWLDSVPAEADVVVRIKGVDAIRVDLTAMLKAMSPTLGDQAGPGLEAMVAQIKGQFGDQAATDEYVMIARGVAPEDPSQPPFAILVKSSNYTGVLASVSGGKEPKLKKEEGGYDSFDAPMGGTWYAAKSGGSVAFGPDKALIAAVAKGGKTAGKGLAPSVAKQFAAGDASIYVNVAALTSRYAEQIAQGKQAMMATLEQAAPQMGNAAMLDMIKSMYGGMFDSAKDADSLVVTLDFAAAGLGVDGTLTLKADAASAKSLASAEPGDASAIAKLGADSAYFVYMNLNAATFKAFQMMGMKMMAPGGKVPAELDAALAKETGRIETIGSVAMGDGMRVFNVSTIADPKAYREAMEISMKAMSGATGPMQMFKDIKSTPEAESAEGFTFTRVEMTLDLEKLAALQPNNPAALAAMKAMYGGDKVTSWMGTKGNQYVQINAKDWPAAKAQLDAYLKGVDVVGSAPGFKAVRDKLPAKANFLMMMSAQGFLKQMIAQMSATLGKPAAGSESAMPKELAFIGMSVNATPANGVEFHLVVPSAVGPVFEKGFAPMMSSLKPPGNP